MGKMKSEKPEGTPEVEPIQNGPTEEEMRQAVEKLARETMTGDLRDCLLDFLKHDKNPLPWDMRTEEGQREAVAKVEAAVNLAVEKAVRIIASDGRATIEAELDQVTTKDSIKATLIIKRDHYLRHDLNDSVKQTVLLVVGGSDPYFGQRKPVTIKPDEPHLPLDDDKDDGSVFDKTKAGLK